MDILLNVLIILLLTFIMITQLFVILKLGSFTKAILGLKESQQVLSDQMSDLEEKVIETQGDVSKSRQQFINFAKAKSGPTDKGWWNNS